MIKRIATFVYYMALIVNINAQDDNQSLQLDTPNELNTSIELITSNDKKAQLRFAAYVSYGNFNFYRNAKGFNSPLVKNDYHSFGVGSMVRLINSKGYSFKCYLGFLHYGITEEFKTSSEEIFRSEINFNAIRSSIHPLNFVINAKEVKFFFGGGGYFNYNLNYNTSISAPRILFIKDNLFKKFNAGFIYQVGSSYRNYSFEINGYNSISDIIDSRLEPSLTLVGITARLVYNF